MKKLEVLLLKIALILSAGCSSPRLIVQTEPQQAEVYLNLDGKTEKHKIGVSPVEIKEEQINETLKISSESTQWIQLTIEKKDFEKRVISLPSNRWGEVSKTMRLQLTPMEDSSTTVTRVLKYFFNAKKFVETKQFDQALAEIDKVLKVDSKMSQAIIMKAGIYFLQNNLNEAKLLYKEALTIDPSSTDAIQMLEKIQNKSGGG